MDKVGHLKNRGKDFISCIKIYVNTYSEKIKKRNTFSEPSTKLSFKDTKIYFIHFLPHRLGSKTNKQIITVGAD